MKFFNINFVRFFKISLLLSLFFPFGAKDMNYEYKSRRKSFPYIWFLLLILTVIEWKT